MARNGKTRITSQTACADYSLARRRKISAIKSAVASGAYAIHIEDIVLGVLREVLEPPS
jgi:anti-sigma28 factor (negative regulator of flagellin synthesis)